MPEEHEDLTPEEIAEKEEARRGYERRKNDEIRQLKARLADMEEKLSNRELGIDDGTDEATRKLAGRIRQLETELVEVQRVALRRPEDDELEPYIQRVLDENPELVAAYPNRVRRLEAARVMARGYKSTEDPGNSPERSNATPTRVHLSGGGPSASRRARSGDNDWAEFQRKMRDPKLSSDEKLELANKWDREHSD